MIKWGAIYFLFFLYRCTFAVIAETLIARLTPLGDTTRYQSKFFGWGVTDSTQLTIAIGSIFRSIFGYNPILIDIGFQTIAFVGLVRLLTVLNIEDRKRILVFLMLPSFTIWSSIASKEAIIVFAMSLVCAQIVRAYRNEFSFGVPTILGWYLVYVYKTHYLPALLFMLSVPILLSHIKQKATLAIILGVISLVPLYFYADVIDQLSFDVLAHFPTGDVNTRATREAFFVERYDVFTKAASGIFFGFFGPTWAEATQLIVRMSSFIESTIILLILGFYVIRRLFDLPLFNFVVMGVTLFWILFATYPVGILNPGAAIRYRTGYELLVLIAVLLLSSRQTYVSWALGAKMHVQRRDLRARTGRRSWIA